MDVGGMIGGFLSWAVVWLLVHGAAGLLVLSPLLLVVWHLRHTATRGLFERGEAVRVAVAERFAPNPRTVATRRARAGAACVSGGLLVALVVAGFTPWSGAGGAVAADGTPLTAATMPADLGPIADAPAPTALPDGLSGLGGTSTPDRPSTGPTGHTAAPTGPKPGDVSRLLHVFGGECLLPSNPQAPGSTLDAQVARMRLCFPTMTNEAETELAQAQSRVDSMTMVQRWAVPLGSDPLTVAQVEAKMTPADRAEYRKRAAVVAKVTADRALLTKASGAFYAAFGPG